MNTQYLHNSCHHSSALRPRWANSQVMTGLVLLSSCTNWVLSSRFNCLFLPGPGRLGLPGILPKNPVSLVLHPGSSDLLRLFCLLPGAGYPIRTDWCCGCIYRYRLFLYTFGSCKAVQLSALFRISTLFSYYYFIKLRIIFISLSFSQTGTPPAMACPPHTNVTRQAPSSPSPCSFSHPLTSLWLALEL